MAPLENAGDPSMQAQTADIAVASHADSDHHSLIFTALSDPVRRVIVERLARYGAMNVGDLSTPFTISAPAISRHLKVLEQAGLVIRTVDRQWRVCTLLPAALMDARLWLDSVLPSNDDHPDRPHPF